MCTLVVPHHQSRGCSLAPAPAVLVEACGTSSECVECFLRHTFSKCPFFPQPLHIVSKALQSCTFFGVCLSHICSKLSCGNGCFLPFPLGFRTHSIAPIAFCGCYHLHQTVWTSYPLLTLLWIFHTGHSLLSPAFCPSAAVWKLRALLSP